MVLEFSRLTIRKLLLISPQLSFETPRDYWESRVTIFSHISTCGLDWYQSILQPL